MPSLPMRILVVEERPEIRSLVVPTLAEGTGLETRGVTLEEALSAVSDFDPEAVVFGSGESLAVETKALRSIRKAHPRLPIVLFSPRFAPGSRGARMALSLGGCTRLPCTRARYAPDRLDELVRGSLRPWVEKAVRASRAAANGKVSMYMETLSAADAGSLRDMIRQRTGVVLDSRRDFLLQVKLAPLARRRGFDSIGDLVGALPEASDGRLECEVIEAVLTNHDSFFRDAKLYDSLREKILPDLIERRSDDRTLNIWSASCSTGQEPYSIAMLLHDRFPELEDWSVRIVATDASLNMVRRAEAGRYDQLEVSRGVPIQMLGRYFERSGDGWRVRSFIRERLEFRAVNLVEAWSDLPPFDLALLRDVLIYFKEDTQRSILDRLRDCVRPGGYLLLGDSTTLRVDAGWEAFQQGDVRGHRRAA